MCRTKKDDVIEPTTPARSQKSARYSGSDPATSRTTEPTTTDSSYRDSKASDSSRTSLKSLKEFLPENPYFFSFAEICRATNNFLSKRIGQSSAWHCSISGKDAVIIQRKYHAGDNFRQKLRQKLKAICSIHHVSLIKLLGVSISGEQIYLVYEYIKGANLEDCLRNNKNPNFSVLSTWISRMQVATDVAQGLEYIHHYTGEALIHNHIKSTSIIVTESNLNAKMAHFGTAELSGELCSQKSSAKKPSSSSNSEIVEVSSEISPSLGRSKSLPKIKGTTGYMAPEYLTAGIVTQKSDVFAFGVVLLELFSGEEPLKYRFDKQKSDYRRVSLIESANEALSSPENGKIRRWIDRRLRDSYPVEVAEKVVRLGLQCVDVEPGRRPEMRYVAGKLSKFYLESKRWFEKMNIPADFTVTMGPR